MRIDLYLKLSRLAKSRSEAQKLCDSGRVRIGGVAIKAAKEIQGGEILEIDYNDKLKQIKVLRLPDKKQVSRSESRLLYSILSS